MGCGASQPSEDVEKKLTNDSPGKSSPVVTTDCVTDFKSATPSPSPKQKETLAQQPMPDASMYVSKTARSDEDMENSSISSYGSPVIQTSNVDTLDPYNQPRPVLSPGYNLENDTGRIGGFDPEAFRKANQARTQTNTNNSWADANSWASPTTNNNNAGSSHNGSHGEGGAYNREVGKQGEQWNQRDYIQSDDIFSTESPQAMQGSSRMQFDDAADPFRAPGGMGHVPDARNKVITNEDDALMDDILGELDEL